jgi:hypothetical protein
LTTFKSDSEALADAQPLSPNESPDADEEAMANAKNGLHFVVDKFTSSTAINYKIFGSTARPGDGLIDKTKYLKVSGVNCTASTGAGITTD